MTMDEDTVQNLYRANKVQQKRIKELEAIILTAKKCLDRGENIEPDSIAHEEFAQALKGGE